MNQMKSSLRELQDKFNSPSLPIDDTINGTKVAVSTANSITEAVRRHQVGKDQDGDRANQQTIIITAEELIEHFER